MRPRFPRRLYFPRRVRAAAPGAASPPAGRSESSARFRHLSSRPPTSQPALFRHPSSRPPVLLHAPGSFIHSTHSFNNGGVSRATSGANSARGGWVGALGRELPRGQRGRHSRPDRRRKGRRPRVATGSRAARRALPSGCPAPAGSASRAGDPAGTGLAAGAPRARLGIWGRALERGS